jgi:hypothetical protein
VTDRASAGPLASETVAQRSPSSTAPDGQTTGKAKTAGFRTLSGRPHARMYMLAAANKLRMVLLRKVSARLMLIASAARVSPIAP